MLPSEGGSQPVISQTISYVMEPAPLDGTSSIDFAKYLSVGEIVKGYMRVTGLWEVEGDYTTPWTFELWNPQGKLMDTKTYNWTEDPYHPFEFTAEIEGEYVIRATHYSSYTRDLVLVVFPSGWDIKQNIETGE
jgi:hypothetical protein